MIKKANLKSIKFIYISILIVMFLNFLVLDLDNSLIAKRRRSCDKFLKFNSFQREDFVFLKEDWEYDPRTDKVTETIKNDELLKMKKRWEPIKSEYKTEKQFFQDLEKFQSDNLNERLSYFKNFCNNYRYNFDNIKSFGYLIALLIACSILVIF